MVAAGGIGDARGVAAVLMLGASAAMLGTAFLRCPEGNTAKAWAGALAATMPEDTLITRGFSGKPGRSIATGYVRAVASEDAPDPAPYPVQRALSAAMRAQGMRDNDLSRLQAWAGQAAHLARAEPAKEVVARLWRETESLLG